MSKDIQCPSCHRTFAYDEFISAMKVCPKCGYHHRLTPAERIESVADKGSFNEFPFDYSFPNPIGLEGYQEKITKTRDKANLEEAVITGECTIDGQEAVLGVMSFDFMGGSMGSVVGEKIAAAMIEGALTSKPVILFTASGGARMQEGIFSLMQMAKTSAAAALLEKTLTPLFIVLTHPTTGGVTASFAMLGDISLSEKGALIGFAGPRVIEGTIGESLPDGFQSAEFQLEKGFIDAIVPREEMKKTLSFLIKVHTGGISNE